MKNKKWDRVREIRHQYVAGADFSKPYWNSESDLESYDSTLAQRIKWKFEFVLNRLDALGWKPNGGTIIDWGCGTGIASRTFFEHFGEESGSEIHFYDHSNLSVYFARKKFAETFPSLILKSGLPKLSGDETVLISHVVTELSADQLKELKEYLKNAGTVIWVDAGTSVVSRTLIQIREELKSDLQVIAPCTHQNSCGLLEEKNQKHWCHFFAESPREIFMSAEWSEFARNLNVHLNELPVSYLVLDKRGLNQKNPFTRILGKPRIYKGYSQILCCNENGINENRLSQRTFPDVFKKFKKEKFAAESVIEVEGNEIVRFEEMKRVMRDE